MKFTVSITKSFFTQEEADKVKEFDFKFQDTYFMGHKYYLPNNISEKEIEINSIEELVQFSDKYGNIIISRKEVNNKPNLEIYNDYRE